MTAGIALTFWSVRIACLLYVAAITAWLRQKPALARVAWTGGLLFYLAHVVAAFTFYHHWSHQAAYRATEKQSGWGGGIYFNYFFTVLWTADAVWSWMPSYRARPRWIGIAIHCFIAFIVFNAAVVFASGPTRWVGVVCTVFLALNFITNRNRAAA